MRPRSGLGLGSAWAQRLRQLEQRLRAKEERIVVLETENAALHLKLAEHSLLPDVLEDMSTDRHRRTMAVLPPSARNNIK